jgi:hypothetical protein
MFGKIISKSLLILLALSALAAIMPQFAFAGSTPVQIKFEIQTGSDALHGNSTATVRLMNTMATGTATSGPLQEIVLKSQKQPAWEVKSTHTVTAVLRKHFKPSDLTNIVITLQSHNGAMQKDNDWSIQSVKVTLIDVNGKLHEIGSQAGKPLARLTGSNPTFSMKVVPPPGNNDAWDQ